MIVHQSLNAEKTIRWLNEQREKILESMTKQTVTRMYILHVIIIICALTVIMKTFYLNIWLCEQVESLFWVQKTELYYL